MKNQKNFTEADLQAVYAALITMSEELAAMRAKVDRICAQAAPAIVYMVDQGKGKTRATA